MEMTEQSRQSTVVLLFSSDINIMHLEDIFKVRDTK